MNSCIVPFLSIVHLRMLWPGSLLVDDPLRKSIFWLLDTRQPRSMRVLLPHVSDSSVASGLTIVSATSTVLELVFFALICAKEGDHVR